MTPPRRAPARVGPRPAGRSAASPPSTRSGSQFPGRDAAIASQKQTSGASPRPRSAPRPTARNARPAAPPPTAARRAAGAAGATALAAPKPRRVVRPEVPPLEVVERAPRAHWRSRLRRRLRALGGLAIAFLFASLLGMAIFHSMLVQGQLGIDRADDQIEQEQMRQRELREQAAALASPHRIVAEAQRRGMVLPQDRVYLPAVVPGSVVPPPPEVPG